MKCVSDQRQNVDPFLELLLGFTPKCLEFVERLRASVSDALRLEPAPCQFRRVESRRVRWQFDTFEHALTIIAPHELGDGVGDIVDAGTIPNHHDRPLHPVEHMRKKSPGFFLRHASGVGLRKKLTRVSHGTDDIEACRGEMSV